MHPLDATMRMLARGGPPEVVDRTDVEGPIERVSTIDTEEGYGYETALLIRGAEWHPVERYDERDDAVAGHARWVNDAPTLTRIVDIGLPAPGYDFQTLIELEK